MIPEVIPPEDKSNVKTPLLSVVSPVICSDIFSDEPERFTDSILESGSSGLEEWLHLSQEFWVSSATLSVSTFSFTSEHIA